MPPHFLSDSSSFGTISDSVELVFRFPTTDLANVVNSLVLFHLFCFGGRVSVTTRHRYALFLKYFKNKSSKNIDFFGSKNDQAFYSCKKFR